MNMRKLEDPAKEIISLLNFLLQVDSLDSLALLGNFSEFKSAVTWIGQNLSFDKVQKLKSLYFYGLSFLYIFPCLCPIDFIPFSWLTFAISVMFHFC